MIQIYVKTPFPESRYLGYSFYPVNFFFKILFNRVNSILFRFLLLFKGPEINLQITKELCLRQEEF